MKTERQRLVSRIAKAERRIKAGYVEKGKETEASRLARLRARLSSLGEEAS
jgi:hypothetical protein